MVFSNQFKVYCIILHYHMQRSSLKHAWQEHGTQKHERTPR